MKLNKELMLFSIISIVFLAGCARGPSTPAANGVVITSFAPDVASTDGSNPVTFVLSVKNLGEKKATDVKAMLFGLSDKWSAATPTAKDALTSALTLAPADPAANLPGEEASITWSANAAPGTTTDQAYDANVRVFYTYVTSGTALLRVVDSSYLRTNPNVIRGLVSSDGTGGPLLLTFTVRSPVVSSDTKTARIQFELQNVGGGRVFTTAAAAAISATNLDTLTKITVQGTNLKSCAGAGAGSGKVELTTQTTSLRLVGGKSKVISCDIDVTTTTFQDIQLDVSIDYNYFVDSATQVTITRALQ